MKKDIKTAVESYVRRVEKAVEEVPESGDYPSFGFNPLLRIDSDFMRGLEMNHPELREIFEDNDFSLEMDDDLKEAIETINLGIRISLREEVADIIRNNRAFFNLDPTAAVDDVIGILESIKESISELVSNYDELIARGDIESRYDTEVRTKKMAEEAKTLYTDDDSEEDF